MIFGYQSRLAKESDWEQVRILDEHITKEVFIDKIEHNSYYVTENKDEYGELTGEIIAILRFSFFWDSIPFINLLYVKEDTRGNKVGSGIVNFWEAELEQDGHTEFMTSTQSNEYGQEFWRKRDYREVGGFINTDGTYELVMRKEIKPIEIMEDSKDED